MDTRAKTLTAASLSRQICYGIIYGMGAKSLGEQMGVEEDDAACYIESFKARYKGTSGPSVTHCSRSNGSTGGLVYCPRTHGHLRRWGSKS